MADSNERLTDIPPVGANRLAALAADVRAMHSGIRRSAEQVARDAVEIGTKLIEAKAGLAHGQWEAWVRDSAGMSTRTASLYMRLGRSGLEIRNIAEIGLAAAGKDAVTRARRMAALERQNQRIRSYGRAALAGLFTIGALFDGAEEELGDRFDKWVREETGFEPDDARFLAKVARVADEGGDVDAVLRDGPKEIRIPWEWPRTWRDVIEAASRVPDALSQAENELVGTLADYKGDLPSRLLGPVLDISRKLVEAGAVKLLAGGKIEIAGRATA